ncbi:MAG: hypothetical protein SGILL_004711, partial [Bacillariaceae sp.]
RPSTTNRATMASGGENPLAADAKLQGLLATVDTLSDEKSFLKWKKSFLKVYTSYLDPDGVLNAKDANYRLLKKLAALKKRVTKVQTLIDNENIHAEQVTTEGRRGLTNLSDELTNAEKAINEFMPKDSKDVDRIGYDKFELGAVLVQDGFHGYDLMVQTRDTMEVITKQQLAGIADQNFLQIHQYYSRSLDVFIQVMEDLGLFQIMKQCVDVVYKGKKRKEPKAPAPLPSEEDDDAALKKLRTTKTTKKTTVIKGKKGGDKSGKSGTGSEDDDADGISKKKRNGGKENTRGGAPGPNGKRMGDPNGLDDEEAETEEKKEEEKDEEEGEGGESEFLYYFDPKTNALGMIDRKLCGAKSKLLVDLEQEGKDAYQNHVQDDQERKQLIWLLKKLEKTKPQEEESWLDKIKREKAEKAGKPLENKNGRKMPAAKSNTKRRSEAPKSAATRRKDVSSAAPDDGKDFKGPGFRDPFAGGSSGSGSKSGGKKKTVENFQGKYKQAAAKPVSGGWKKMT